MDALTSIAISTYNRARPATEPVSAPPGEAAVHLTRDFTETLRTGEETAKAAMAGGADPYALVQALAATELAIETAVTVRDRVVEAYQEILRMPV